MKHYQRSYMKTTVAAGAIACALAIMLLLWLSRGCLLLDCTDNYFLVAGPVVILVIATLFFLVVTAGGALALYYDRKSRVRW